MAANLPLWYGRERGTSLVSLVDFDEGTEVEVGFLDRMSDRLFGWINDFHAGVVGFFVPFLTLIIATSAAAATSPALAAALALAALAWAAGAGYAAWRVSADGEEAPSWATGILKALITFGRILIVSWIIGTVVAVIVVFLSLVIGISAMDQ